MKPPMKPTIRSSKLDAFGNALIDLENILPDLSVLPEGGAELPPRPITLSTLYFCIPQNDKMLEYWDRIGDRLFKIRHCQNIDGVERSLALFAPPIDPGMLVRAAAAGLESPRYCRPQRATALLSLQRRAEGERTGPGSTDLGNSLLQALERRMPKAWRCCERAEIKVLDAD